MNEIGGNKRKKRRKMEGVEDRKKCNEINQGGGKAKV
jgi:hypothetical protein